MKQPLFAGALALLLVAGAGVTVSAQRDDPPAAMTAAAKAFLGTLDEKQKAQAQFPFASEERLNWHFIPRARKGLPLKEMTEPQRRAALALLRAGFSQEGFDKVALIRDLEKILKATEMGRGPVRDHELYFFSVFGQPSETGTWGWRYEGHHCAHNWTLVNGKSVASSPQFFGSNPAEVRVDVPDAPARGTKVLAKEELVARKLLAALSDEEKKVAILNTTAPADIITGAQRQAAIQEDTGIAYGKLSGDKRRLLLDLIRVYTDVQPKKLADERLARLRKAGLDGIKFAWMGPTEVNQGHYYRVQGPTFLIEYDNTQNNANHVHAVWRDFKGDFGLDLLAMHYHASPHRVAKAR
jgi:hypothetical protein